MWDGNVRSVRVSVQNFGVGSVEKCMREKMKPVTLWKLSSQTWTLRDMLASEVIKKGATSPDFAHAVYDLIKGRVDDPEVSEEDIRNLTFKELGEISGLIAEKMMETLRMELALSRMSSMVEEVHKDSKPS
jgi:hypothetical protein